MEITFVSTMIPYPYDKNGFTENIFNIIYYLKQNKNIKIRYFVFAKETFNKDVNTFQGLVDQLIFKRPISKYLFPFMKFFYKKIDCDGKVFFCDFNSGYYYDVFEGEKILYSADSPSYYYSKNNNFKSILFFCKYVVEEKILYKNFNKIIFVSDNDLKFSKSRTNNKGVQIPIGYNFQRVKNSDKDIDLIFTGNFNYKPNHEGAEWFLDNILEELILILPKVKIGLVGRNPTKKMIKYSKRFTKNLEVTGEVDSVEDFLARSRVYISPLLSGSGMKNKILQAMAAKLPIIATNESMTGFGNYSDISVRIVENKKDFLKEIVYFIKKNEVYLSQIGENNQIFFLENYSWQKIIKKYYYSLFNV